LERKPKKDTPDSPFSSLKNLKKELHEEEKRYRPDDDVAKQKFPEKDVSDDELFANAMRGTNSLSPTDVIQATAPAIVEDLSQGSTSEKEKHLEFRTRTEAGIIEGALVDLGPQILRKLKRGQIAIEDSLDLHGSNSHEAHTRLAAFIESAVKSNMRCVLLVHGKGYNSTDGTPVLKKQMHTWLSTGRLAAYVLAYVSAQPADGGTGALYLLLRRKKGA
jgi:DNA-nicking Smr family endonuclease